MKRQRPAIFLAVAAFLTSMVLNRLIAIERSEIGCSRRSAIRTGRLGWHYAQLVIAISMINVRSAGSARGSGAASPRCTPSCTVPFIVFRPSPWVYAVAATVSVGSRCSEPRAR